MHFFLHYSRYNTAEISFICQMFFRFDRASYLALSIRSIFALYLVFIGCLISVGSTLLQSLPNRYPTLTAIGGQGWGKGGGIPDRNPVFVPLCIFA